MREVVDARNFIAGSVLAFLLFEFGRKVDVANSHLTLCLLLMATGILSKGKLSSLSKV